MFSRLKQKLKEESLTTTDESNAPPTTSLNHYEKKNKSFDNLLSNKISNSSNCQSSSDETSEKSESIKSRDSPVVNELITKLDSFKQENEAEDNNGEKFRQLNASLLRHIEILHNEINEKINENDTIRMELSRINIKLESLEFENENYKEICNKLETDLCELKEEKDELIIKNAELSQKYELLKLVNNKPNTNNIDSISSKQSISINNNNKSTESSSKEDEKEHLQKQIDDNKVLRDDLNEKNKMIKNLQQRLNDMKKTLQKELKYQSLPNENINSSPEQAIKPESKPIDETHFKQVKRVATSLKKPSGQLSSLHDDVNFKYLKHVVLKFLTSKEYEAIHLVKALSVLLNFTNDEEKVLKETLEWKMSWFGSRPKIQ